MGPESSSANPLKLGPEFSSVLIVTRTVIDARYVRVGLVVHTGASLTLHVEHDVGDHRALIAIGPNRDRLTLTAPTVCGSPAHHVPPGSNERFEIDSPPRPPRPPADTTDEPRGDDANARSRDNLDQFDPDPHHVGTCLDQDRLGPVGGVADVVEEHPNRVMHRQGQTSSPVVHSSQSVAWLFAGSGSFCQAGRLAYTSR